jgi:hypothetical protein
VGQKRPSGGWRTWSGLVGLTPLAMAVCLALRPHPHASAEPHGDLGAAIPIALATVGVLPLLTATRRPAWRHTAALALIALLTVLGVETALHSVHHLGDTDAEASCVVTAAGTHLSGVTISLTDLDEPAATFERAGEGRSTWSVSLQPIRPREGRAPPAPVLA